MQDRQTTGVTSWMPFSRATAQVWAIEQLRDALPEHRTRRHPLRSVVRRVATALGR